MKPISKKIWMMVLTAVTMLFTATQLWGAVTVKGPTKPVAANGSKVNLSLQFSEVPGPTEIVTVTIDSDPNGIITELTGNQASVRITRNKGTGKVSFRVPKNASSLGRSATLNINGTSFTVNQNGQPCRVSISPAKSRFQFFGGDGSFNVAAPAGCQWNATKTAEWITLTTGSGSGNGVVNFIAAENRGKNRNDKIRISGIDPLTQLPTAAKTHTVDQKELKLTSTVKIGTPTTLDTPEKAAKAFSASGVAVEGLTLLNDGLGSFDELLGGSGVPFKTLARKSSSPIGSTLRKLQPLINKSRKITAKDLDVSSDFCTTGTAVVSGLNLSPTGELLSIPSALTINLNNCLIQESTTTVNGMLTVKGISFNQASGSIRASIILGQSAAAPLQITEADFSFITFLTLKLSASQGDSASSAMLQADGFVDMSDATGRSVIEMKGIKASVEEQPSKPTAVTFDGLLRASGFKGSDFISSFEIKMAGFDQTLDDYIDPVLGQVEEITVNGTLGLLSTPANACIDGTFNINTTKSLKTVNDNLVEGTVVINGATININSDGSSSITANGQTAAFSKDQMDNVCSMN